MPTKTLPAPDPPKLDASRLPRHIAIIMDGNGRWARSKGLARLAGHKAGVESVREVVRVCAELGVEALTLYSFSTENWLRPREEVQELMRLLAFALKREAVELKSRNVRLRAFGRLDALPKPVRSELERSMEFLKDCTGLSLNLALNYGARQEIVDAVNRLIASGAREVSERDFSDSLYTAGFPDPDLVIRTSGEMRVSNFLLWQIAYAELYVTPVFWPQFRRDHLLAAIVDYQGRQRRFGGLSAPA